MCLWFQPPITFSFLSFLLILCQEWNALSLCCILTQKRRESHDKRTGVFRDEPSSPYNQWELTLTLKEEKDTGGKKKTGEPHCEEDNRWADSVVQMHQEKTKEMMMRWGETIFASLSRNSSLFPPLFPKHQFRGSIPSSSRKDWQWMPIGSTISHVRPFFRSPSEMFVWSLCVSLSKWKRVSLVAGLFLLLLLPKTCCFLAARILWQAW